MITVIAMILVIIGAINWFCIGVGGFNLVAWICSQNMIAQRVIYILVGICALWLIGFLSLLSSNRYSVQLSQGRKQETSLRKARGAGFLQPSGSLICKIITYP